ncbi:MAG: diacylglycerol kinase [Desulfuromonadales bacterium]|jgi:diacylglycerol kinase (ATP)
MNGLKPSNWLERVNCAIEGILWAARTQLHLRYHLVAAVGVLLLAVFFRISTLEFILLTFAVTLVIFAELINTALEVVVDMVSPEFHPLARRAKDVAAGAVLASSIGTVVIGYMALSRFLFPSIAHGLNLLGRPAGELPVVAVLVVIIAVVLLKALFGRGTPLHGGMPSGHAAVAFSVATSIALSQVAPLIILLVLVLAAMVSHSRLLLGIHTLKEVLSGALLGAGLTFILYLMFA